MKSVPLFFLPPCILPSAFILFLGGIPLPFLTERSKQVFSSSAKRAPCFKVCPCLCLVCMLALLPSMLEKANLHCDKTSLSLSWELII